MAGYGSDIYLKAVQEKTPSVAGIYHYTDSGEKNPNHAALLHHDRLLEILKKRLSLDIQRQNYAYSTLSNRSLGQPQKTTGAVDNQSDVYRLRTHYGLNHPCQNHRQHFRNWKTVGRTACVCG